MFSPTVAPKTNGVPWKVELSTLPILPLAMTSLIFFSVGETCCCNPTTVLMPFSLASANISSACLALEAKGHSQKTSFPALMLGRSVG